MQTWIKGDVIEEIKWLPGDYKKATYEVDNIIAAADCYTDAHCREPDNTGYAFTDQCANYGSSSTRYYAEEDSVIEAHFDAENCQGVSVNHTYKLDQCYNHLTNSSMFVSGTSSVVVLALLALIVLLF